MKKLLSLIIMISMIFTVLITDTKAKTEFKFVSSDIKNGSKNIVLNKSIMINFNEAIVKGAGFPKICLADDKKNQTLLNITINKTILKISHKAQLKYSTNYTLLIPVNAIKNSKGVGLKKPFTIKFRTIDKPSPTAKPKLSSNSKPKSSGTQDIKKIPDTAQPKYEVHILNSVVPGEKQVYVTIPTDTDGALWRAFVKKGSEKIELTYFPDSNRFEGSTLEEDAKVENVTLSLR